jgi:hypothetical protein
VRLSSSKVNAEHIGLRSSKETLDESVPRLNGEILRIRSSDVGGYDCQGMWLAEFNRACDKFLASRGIDPREGHWDTWIQPKKKDS